MTVFYSQLTSDTTTINTFTGANTQYCNNTVIRLIGTDTLGVDATTLMNQNEWASGTNTKLEEYTDGYRVYVTMTIQTTPQVAATTNAPYNNGMCFGEVDPITNGGFCFIYQSDGATDNMPQDANMVVWYAPGQWIDLKFPGVPKEYEDHANYPTIIQLESGDGYKIRGETNGLVMVPKGTSGTTNNAYQAGDQLSASWYQPITSEYYSLIPRLHGAKPDTNPQNANPLTDATIMKAWGIIPTPLDSNGYNDLVLCGPTAGVSLQAAQATMLMFSGVTVILSTLY